MRHPDDDRRKYRRKDDRTEMLFGSGRTSISNLSLTGAYVSILAGLNLGDTFSFELDLDDDSRRPVRGKAVVVWTDPGVGAGVRFELTPEERSRLASYLQELDLIDPADAEAVPPAVPEAAGRPAPDAADEEPRVVLRFTRPDGSERG